MGGRLDLGRRLIRNLRLKESCTGTGRSSSEVTAADGAKESALDLDIPQSNCKNEHGHILDGPDYVSLRSRLTTSTPGRRWGSTAPWMFDVQLEAVSPPPS